MSGSRSDVLWMVMGLLAVTGISATHLNHPKAGYAEPKSKLDLQQDIDDFLDLIPKEEVQNLTQKFYYGDGEVRFAYAYCQSDEFLALREKILNLPEVKDFLNYLNESGLNLVELVNKLAKIVGPPSDHVTLSEEEEEEEDSAEDTSNPDNASQLGGVSGFVDAIVSILPQDQILSLFFTKLETSSAFSNLIERIGSSEFERVLDFVENSRELKSLLATLHQHGIDVSKIVQSIQAFFGWGSY
ncbi:Insect allergen-related [Sergentomyia squamirostris]